MGREREEEEGSSLASTVAVNSFDLLIISTNSPWGGGINHHFGLTHSISIIHRTKMLLLLSERQYT